MDRCLETVGVLLAVATFACAGEPKPAAAPHDSSATSSVSGEPEAASTSREETAFAIASIVLYQPDSVLQQRLPNGVEAFGEFLKQVEGVAVRAFPPGQPPQEFDIVIAIKPGRLARFWFIASAASDPKLEETLRGELNKLAVPSVQGGPVAVAIIGSIAGAPTSDKAEPFAPPMPAEWREAVQRAKADALQVPDGVLPIVWPD